MKTTDLNIVNTIERENIESFVPKLAQFAQLSKYNEFIQKFYLIDENGILKYYGEQGGWHYSEYNKEYGTDILKLKQVSFLEILN